jgi:hypothetical protein
MATETTAHGEFVNNLKSRIQRFIQEYLSSENWRSESSVTLSTKQPGSIYVVDDKIFSPALLKNYRATLPDTKR